MTAFSNGFEFDCWTENWCARCAREEGSNVCQILDQPVIFNEVPPQWTPGTDDLRDRYHCNAFEEA